MVDDGADSGAASAGNCARQDREIKVAMLRLEDCINVTCPWSGKPVQADSLTRYQGEVVGFCNPGCRNKFEQAIAHFESAGKRASKAPGRAS